MADADAAAADPATRSATGKVFRYQKYRESYRWRDVEIVVDETPIGTFLEIEGPVATIHARRARAGPRPRGLHRRLLRGAVLRVRAARATWCSREGDGPGRGLGTRMRPLTLLARQARRCRC